ncbi:MAG: transcriptional repressor LexA [Blastocatellia bacterium]
MPVTPRLRQIYDYLCRYSDKYSYAPTIAEIGKQFNLSSPASVHHILSGLEREGLIRRIPNVSRGIEVVRPEPAEDEFEIPLLGVVAAGQPIEAILSQETLSIPRDMTGSGRLFALRVRGDSMIGEQIREGDFIVCESRQTATNGQTVVALVDGSDATVKKFYKERDNVRLEPANPKYKPIVVKADRVTIQGVVRGLIRKYQVH